MNFRLLDYHAGIALNISRAPQQNREISSILAQMQVSATENELKFMIAAMLAMGITLLDAVRHLMRYVCTKCLKYNPPLASGRITSTLLLADVVFVFYLTKLNS